MLFTPYAALFSLLIVFSPTFLSSVVFLMNSIEVYPRVVDLALCLDSPLLLELIEQLLLPVVAKLLSETDYIALMLLDLSDLLF